MKFVYSKGITCCKNCVPPKRHVGCHSTCETYIKAKEEYKKEKDELDKIKRTRMDMTEVMLKRNKKLRRYK